MAKAKKKTSAVSRAFTTDAQQITDVPPGRVGQIVQQFVMGGARQVTCVRQADGNWTITAV